MTGDLIEQDMTCKIGGRLTSQYKHSANFLGVYAIVNKSGHWRYETWHTVADDAPWEASSLSIEGLEKSPFVNGRRVFFPRHASTVVLCFC